MREVAVTEGDKVEAQRRLGYAVNGYGVGDLVEYVNEVCDAEVDALIAEYEERYNVAPALRTGGDRHESLRDGARHRARPARFLEAGSFKGFTDTFEDLHGLNQLPGLAVAAADGRRLRLRRRGRLEDRGPGARDEGDGQRPAGRHLLHGGLHLSPRSRRRLKVLGAHMLEICRVDRRGQPSLEIHPLGIGGKDDPVRLVFDARSRARR